jgi:serine phosphatase RsbU (regulator of sigma subunit)
MGHPFYRFIAMSCLLLCSLASSAQPVAKAPFMGDCFSRYFGVRDYNAHNQNWDAVQDKRGLIYVANTVGVLEFDGTNWHYIYSNTAALSLSVDSASGIVFVGGSGSLGYLQPNEFGKTRFCSLTHLLPKGMEDIGDVWYTFATPKGVFFITNNYIFRFRNGKFKAWSSEGRFHTAFCLKGNIYIRKKGEGLVKINEETIDFVPGTEILADSRLDVLLPKGPGEYFLAGRELGMMTGRALEGTLEKGNATGLKIEKVKSNMNAFLEEKSLYRGIRLSSGEYALGTMKGGLVILDPQLNLSTIINKTEGLPELSILNVFEDNQHNIWLALYNGIGMVEYLSPFRKMADRHGIMGGIESIGRLKDSYYFGGFLGLFQKKDASNKAEQILKNPTECWDVQAFIPPGSKEADRLLVATKNGCLEIKDGVEQNLILPGQTVLRILPSHVHPGEVYLGTKTGILLIEYSNGTWIQKGKIGNFNETIGTLIEKPNGEIWYTNNNDVVGMVPRTLFGVPGEKPLSSLEVITYGTEDGITSDHDNFAFMVQNEMVLGTPSGLFHPVWDKRTKRYRFVPYSKLGRTFTQRNRGIQRIKEDSSGNVWIISTVNEKKSEHGVALKQANGSYVWNYAPFNRIQEEGDPKDIWISSEKQILIAGTVGVVNYSMNFPYPAPNDPFKAFVRSMISEKDSLFAGSFRTLTASKIFGKEVFIPNINQDNQDLIIPYKQNNLYFNFGSNQFIVSNENVFSVFLEGNDKTWSDWSQKSERSYTNLSEGNYILHVKCRNIFGKESKEGTIRFTILPPWYRTFWAYVIYLLLCSGGFLFIIRAYTRGLNRIIEGQTKELRNQKSQIEFKNKEITDSIVYAKRIQDALMPSYEDVTRLFPQSFIFYRPKDIVSGDFYWAGSNGDQKILAVVDCTGHGVPGAFMSLMGNDNLNEIVNQREITQPEEILEQLRTNIIRALKQRRDGSTSKDGMDAVICRVNYSIMQVDFAGANNPLYFIRPKTSEELDGHTPIMENETHRLYEIKGNKFPVGIFLGNELPRFVGQRLHVKAGDALYLFSDGFADQFGGPLGKKYKYNQLKKLLLDVQVCSMQDQQTRLISTFESWKGDHEQVDDVLIIGVTI